MNGDPLLGWSIGLSFAIATWAFFVACVIVAALVRLVRRPRADPLIPRSRRR
jgi:hypothetical protein